jgi:serine protease Do
VDCQPIHDLRDLAQKIGAKSPGTSVQLGVLRDGEPETFTAALGEMSNQQRAGADTGQQERSARLGLSLAPSEPMRNKNSVPIPASRARPLHCGAKMGS